MPDNKGELPLPVDKLPECWNDKARMNALYAPFRNRSVNPHDWDSKLNFWKNLIAKWCVHHKRSTFSLPELTKAFQCEGRAPACLEIVVNELYNNGNLQTIPRFMQTPQETWTGWAMDLLVKKPLVWSFNKVKESVVSPTNENTVYVNIDAIKTQADDILSLVNESCCNKVLSFEEFINVLDLKDWEKGNLNFVLHYLRCRGKVSLKENVEIESGNEKKHLTLIKVSSASEKLSPINDSDIALYNLEQNEKYIMKNLERLECEKEACINEAKECLAKGMRLAAKSCLRKKHAIETTINSRVATLDNVRVLTGRVRDAETDARVLEAYRRGAAALKNTLTDAGLNEDTAAEAVTDVQDMLDIHKDIQSGLSLKLDESTDSDLEEELADLLASDDVPPSGGTPTSSPRKQAAVKTPQNQHEDIERRLKALHMNLPDVPKSPPSMPNIARQIEEF